MKSMYELKDDRIRLGLSQKAVAEAMGTTQSALSRVESEEGNPTQALLMRYEHALEKLRPTQSVLEIVTLKLSVARLVEKYHIAEMYVFGSVARGDARPDSNVDLLYRLKPDAPRSLGSVQELMEDLEALLGRKVSLTSYDALLRSAERSRASRRFLEHIQLDMIKVA